MLINKKPPNGQRLPPCCAGLLSQQRQGGLLPLAGPLLCAAALRPPGPSSLCSLPRAVSDAAAGGAERHLSTAAAEAQPQQQQEGQLDSLLPEDRMGSSQEASTSGEPAGPGGGPAARAFVTESRRVTSARKGGAVAMQGSLEGIVHISNTFNNIIMTLTDKQGFIKTYTSAGQVGFKGARKSQPVAAERAAEELARRAQKLGYTTVQVRLQGMRGG